MVCWSDTQAGLPQNVPTVLLFRDHFGRQWLRHRRDSIGMYPDLGRFKSLDTDFSFGPYPLLLSALNDPIATPAVSDPYHPGVASDFAMSVPDDQDLILGHINAV
jgi:hypothetical protein